MVDPFWRRVLGIVIEQGGDAVRWRYRIEWRWPRLVRTYTVFPTFPPLPPMSVLERQAAQTPSEWKAGEQSDNLATRKP